MDEESLKSTIKLLESINIAFKNIGTQCQEYSEVINKLLTDIQKTANNKDNVIDSMPYLNRHTMEKYLLERYINPTEGIYYIKKIYDLSNNLKKVYKIFPDPLYPENIEACYQEDVTNEYID